MEHCLVLSNTRLGWANSAAAVSIRGPAGLRVVQAIDHPSALPFHFVWQTWHLVLDPSSVLVPATHKLPPREVCVHGL
jgi:hypothetical protein